jgi:hypothetical protein
MIRSGSTWSYNVCQALLVAAFGAASVESTYSESLRDWRSYAASDRHAVIKCHALDDESKAWLSQIDEHLVSFVYTVRDPRDVAASAYGCFGYAPERSKYAALMSLQFLDWQRQVGAVSIVPHASIVQRPQRTVALLARHLKLTVADTEIVKIADEWSEESVRAMMTELFSSEDSADILAEDGYVYHRPTHLHKKHFRRAGTPDWPELLTPQEQKEFATEFHSWRMLFELPVAISMKAK